MAVKTPDCPLCGNGLSGHMISDSAIGTFHAVCYNNAKNDPKLGPPKTWMEADERIRHAIEERKLAISRELEHQRTAPEQDLLTDKTKVRKEKSGSANGRNRARDRQRGKGEGKREASKAKPTDQPRAHPELHAETEPIPTETIQA